MIRKAQVLRTWAFFYFLFVKATNWPNKENRILLISFIFWIFVIRFWSKKFLKIIGLILVVQIEARVKSKFYEFGLFCLLGQPCISLSTRKGWPICFAKFLDYRPLHLRKNLFLKIKQLTSNFEKVLFHFCTHYGSEK